MNSSEDFEQLTFPHEWLPQPRRKRHVSGVHSINSRLYPEWPEEKEREWREKSALKTVLTTHLIDNPCKMGREHYGGCWYNVPGFDEFIAKIHRKRLDAMQQER